MDNNYQPSFEVVDKAEDAEDYLLAKNRRTTESKQTTQTENPTTNSTSTYCDIAIKDDDKMNFNGMNFLSGASECKDIENDKVDSKNGDVLKCITEDEEGQEALWLEESENTPSASSMNASPAVTKSSARRSSFLFGNGSGATKKVAKISPKRTISLRKKKNVPKVMLLDGLSDAKSSAPAVVPTVSSDVDPTSKDVAMVAGKAVSQPDAVIASDTISSLGFDKSFDVKSPLSMSSLNEILDAPLTPTATADESAADATAAVEPKKKRTKKNVVSGMFRKKEKNVKTKSSFSFMSRSRYARSVVVVEKEEKEDDDADVVDPVLFATRDINERIQASLMRAMENDDAESLTSFTGVPMIMKEDNNSNSKPNEKPKSLTMLQGQKPLNFEKVKPTFVVSKDSLTMAEIQEKFVPMYDDDEEDEEKYEEEQNLTSPCSSNEGEQVEALKSKSPNSTGADSAVTDKYEVAQNIGDDNESDFDDGKSDKYSVLPDPCSFCDSFWIATDNQSAVSKTLSESPDKNYEQNKCDPEMLLDSPVIDKYAELPEVVDTTKDDDDTEQEPSISRESTFNKSTTVATSNRTFSSLFGKFKRQPSVSAIPETMVASSNATSSRNVEPALSEPEKRFTSEFTNGESNLNVEDEDLTCLSTEPIIVASKQNAPSFFGKVKMPFTSKSKSADVASDPSTSVVEASTDAPVCEDMSRNLSTVAPSKAVPRKSILKKRKEVMMIPVDEPTSYIVPGNDLESPGAKISVLSLGSEPYEVPAAATSMTVTSKSTASLEQHPIEDPSTEGSSSADDDITNAKIVSIEPVSPTKASNTDPLLTRLRKNLHKRRGLEPQTDIDPIISVGNGRTRLDP